MKYNPKKLTYGDALRIATANMTVTVEDENGQHVRVLRASQSSQDGTHPILP